jgi:hypothetical protein
MTTLWKNSTATYKDLLLQNWQSFSKRRLRQNFQKIYAELSCSIAAKLNTYSIQLYTLLGARGRQSRATGSTATPTTVLRVVQWNAEEVHTNSNHKVLYEVMWREIWISLQTYCCKNSCTVLFKFIISQINCNNELSYIAV